MIYFQERRHKARYSSLSVCPAHVRGPRLYSQHLQKKYQVRSTLTLTRDPFYRKPNELPLVLGQGHKATLNFRGAHSTKCKVLLPEEDKRESPTGLDNYHGKKKKKSKNRKRNAQQRKAGASCPALSG